MEEDALTDEQIRAYLILTGYRDDQSPLEKRMRRRKVTEQGIREAIAHGYI